MKNDTTQTLPGIPKKPGRPKTANPKTGKERTRQYRERTLFDSRHTWTICNWWKKGLETNDKNTWIQIGNWLHGASIWEKEEQARKYLEFLYTLAWTHAMSALPGQEADL